MSELLDYYAQDDFSAHVWESKYAKSGEKTPDDMHLRMAEEFAKIRAGKDQSKTLGAWKDHFYQLFRDFANVLPQGRVMAGLGATENYRSLSNCLRLPPPKDSYSSIMYVDTMLVSSAKRGCGYGVGLSNLRPEQAATTNAANSSSGVIAFGNRYSNSTHEVGQQGRRGACLLDLDVRHPSAPLWAVAKKDPTVMTGANISFKIWGDFIQAVREDKDYLLRWPVSAVITETPTAWESLPYNELTKLDYKDLQYVKRIKARELWNSAIHGVWSDGCPGLQFWERITEYDPASVYANYEIDGTNACFSGDTMIAVADGRNSVSIKELAEEGKDVAVYSIDPHTGELSIQWGRNPRVTERNRELLRVHFDNESFIDVTADHKFPLRNGETKIASELKEGDSLFPFRKNPERMKEGNEKEYYRVSCNGWNVSQDKTFEHRMIGKFFYPDEWNETWDEGKKNGWVKGGLIVHHKDYDGLNNSPYNLGIMNFKEHQQFHADHDTKGDKNGKWKKVTNQQIEQYAIDLCKKLNRRFSKKEWMGYALNLNIPKSISKFRMNGWFKSITELSMWAAASLGVEYIKENPRLVNTYLKMLEQGYEAKIENGNVMVKRICEYSGEPFWVSHLKRNVSFFSIYNSLAKRNQDKEFHKMRIEKSQKGHEKRMENIRKEQARIYSDLKFELKRKPLLKEVEQKCKQDGISIRLNTKYGYKNYENLVESGENYNHKVSRIEKLQTLQDVYNITVDHNHTVGIITRTAKNTSDNTIYEGVFAFQCGEQPMAAFDTCRLIAENLFGVVANPFKSDAHVDFEKLYQNSYEQLLLGDDLVDLECIYIQRIIDKILSDPEPMEEKLIELTLWNKVLHMARNGRRVGCGITGLADMLAAVGLKYDSEEALELTECVMHTKMEAELDATITLAEKYGPFKGWDPSLEFVLDNEGFPIAGKNDFYEFLLEEFPVQTERMCRVGRRNVNWSTIAPVGTLSIITKAIKYPNISSGCEPQFALYFFRNKKVSDGEPFDYKDEVGIKWKTYPIMMGAFKDWIEITRGVPAEEFTKEQIEELYKLSPWYGATAPDISWKKRVDMQAILQKYTTSAISSTINLSKDTKEETISEIYMYAFEKGLKGITCYREGSKGGVLVTEKKTTEFEYKDAPKRPKELPAELNIVSVKGVKYAVVVGLMQGKPYELFAFPLPAEQKAECSGFIIKLKKGAYSFKCEDGTAHHMENAGSHEQQMLTRLVSGMLRHGAKPTFVMQQIDKCELEVVSFGKAIGRVLKRYISDEDMIGKNKCKECGSTNLRVQEGCLVCIDCSHSKCG